MDSNSGFRRLTDNVAQNYSINNNGNKSRGAYNTEILYNSSNRNAKTLGQPFPVNRVNYQTIPESVNNNSKVFDINYNNNNSFLSVNEERDIQYNTCYEKYVQVCSNDRDTSIYPDPNNYKINFEKIKNVVEVELVSVILPNQNNILDEPYVLIEINELPSNIEFSSNNIKNAFAILPMKKPNKDTGSFIIPELGQNYRTPLKLKTPIASLQSFTISIKDLNGNLFDFGSDTPTPTKSLQNSFVFKIKRMEKDMKDINVRSVY